MDNFTPNLPMTYSNGIWKESDQAAPDEIGVKLFVNGSFWLTFMCSPFQIEHLAVGFLFNEQIISSVRDVAYVSVCTDMTNVDVWLNFSVEKPHNWRRTSGCSAGQTSAPPMEQTLAAVTDPVSPAVILSQFENLLSAQEQYRSTRGIHCSVLSDGKQIHLVAEDIGRHNTLDKLAGQFLMTPRQLEHIMILTTGRVSSEMLQKSVRIGAEFLISRTSPTQASIRTARELNITLIGYARRNQFTVYAHPERMDVGLLLPHSLPEDAAVVLSGNSAALTQPSWGEKL